MAIKNKPTIHSPAPLEDRASPTSTLQLIFRAFRYRNYRLFFGGQSISLIGTWMQSIALAWLVYRLTNSALLLGIVGFAGQIPSFLFAPFAGVFADRLNRRNILVGTQSLAMVQAFILSALVLTHVIAVWHILALSFFLGLVNSVDIPTRQSFVVDLVEKREDIGNAIALNSSMFNSARLIGPSIAGVLIAAVGEGLCFLINAISYIAVIIALLAMRVAPRSRDEKNAHVLHRLREGFSYAFGFAPIKAILLLLALISIMGMPYAVLMPIFAKKILHGGPHTLGFLMAATGIGALCGAIYLAQRKSAVGLEKVIPRAATVFGIGLIAFSQSRVLALSLALMVMTGFGFMVQMASSNTVLQTIVDDDKRGRVMSIYAMAFMGMAPFGSLLAGGLASRIGAPNTLLFGGVCCIIGALLFARRLPALRKVVRPVYERKGILPQVASGIQSATQLTIPPEE